MSEGTLFNPGFLGAHFNWWIGQIADDSTWRDNILPGKFQDPQSVPGWGARYKVRIIGLHDKEEETIPSDQLPWANVMYPITAGGGQTGASQSPNLRQGMFVFGFFLDGNDQQVPVIMGVLGNNAQTALKTTIGNNQSNFAATSGFAQGKDPPVGTARPKVPDDRLLTQKPKDPVQSEECAPPPSGVSINEFGLRADKSLNSQQFADQQSAIAEANARGLTGTERSQFIQKSVSDGIKARCEAANAPTSPARPGATIENSEAMHLLNNADVKRNELYLKKRVVMSPCDVAGSAMKAIRVLLENLTSEIDKILHSAQSYIDAASSIVSDIQQLVSNFACQIAKYMKIIFDKIKEYILKQINKGIAPTVDIMYPNQRHLFLDIKEQITELINCLFSKITDGLCALIEGALNQSLDTENASPSDSAPYVPGCSVEQLTADVLAANQDEINGVVDSALDSVNEFLSDIQDGLSLISSDLGNISSKVSSISSSITTALSFENIKLNVFGCDLKPNCPVSNYYTLQSGGGASEESQMPNFTSITKAIQSANTIIPQPAPPFALPSKNLEDMIYDIQL